MITFAVVVLLAILVAAFCGFLEATLYSTSLSTLEAERDSGSKRASAKRFIAMKTNIGVSIASILVLNTLAVSGGATLVGMLAGDVLGPRLLPVFSALFSFAILLFAEITPKTLAAIHWRKCWPLIIWPLTAMNVVFYPIVVATRWFSRVLAGGESQDSVTEAEILAVVRMGAKYGQISEKESRLVHNIINLEEKQVRKIMTPRTVVFSLDGALTVGEAARAAEGKGLTRIPIYEEDREDIIGYVLSHDLFSTKTLREPNASIRTLAKPISFIPETANVLALLTTSLELRNHIFVVVDEWGSMAGIVTLEDVIEEILGHEIVDETDKSVNLRETARKRRRQKPSE
ncbi:MAG: hemolysin family protein [Pseudomonadota bacterium]